MPEPIYSDQPKAILSQGDIILDVLIEEFISGQKQSGRYPVVVLSHDCEIVKPSNNIVLVSRVRLSSERDAATQGNIRSNRVVNAMFLPAVNQLEDSYADFRYTYRVSKSDLERGIANGQRIASMTEDGQSFLHTLLTRFFARETINSLLAE